MLVCVGGRVGLLESSVDILQVLCSTGSGSSSSLGLGRPVESASLENLIEVGGGKGGLLESLASSGDGKLVDRWFGRWYGSYHCAYRGTWYLWSFSSPDQVWNQLFKSCWTRSEYFFRLSWREKNSFEQVILHEREKWQIVEWFQEEGSWRSRHWTVAG